MSISRGLARLVPQVTYSFKAFPGQGQSLEVLATQMLALGNSLVEVDHEGGFVLCAQLTEASDSWGCMLCLGEGEIVLTDSEAELRAHLELVHEGFEIDPEGVPVVAS